MKPEPLLRPREVAELLGVHRSRVGRLVDAEGLPAVRLSVGPRGRRSLRFDAEEVREWLKARREGQIRRTLAGERFTRSARAGGRL